MLVLRVVEVVERADVVEVLERSVGDIARRLGADDREQRVPRAHRRRTQRQTIEVQRDVFERRPERAVVDVRVVEILERVALDVSERRAPSLHDARHGVGADRRRERRRDRRDLLTRRARPPRAVGSSIDPRSAKARWRSAR
jgi:hypothetical protein